MKGINGAIDTFSSVWQSYQDPASQAMGRVLPSTSEMS